MNNISANGTRSTNSPLIVEVIGLAGAGKSTFARTLCLESEQFTMGSYLDVRNPRHVPYMVRHTLLSLPTILRKPRQGRWFTLRELTKVVYLDGWNRTLKSNNSDNSATIIIDQGPIYEMATLYSFGPEELRNPRYNLWWGNLFERWAQTIDMVIWLVAPMEILIERIHSREKWHPVKESSVREMRKYLSRYQSAYEYVMSELLANHDISVLQLSTGSNTVEDIMTQALNAIFSHQDETLQKGS